MNSSVPISVCIIVRNGEKTIQRCLESIRWADEMIVVDSGSTDQTIALCQSYTPKVFSRPFTDYADQRNYAISLAQSEWIFFIDADEEVTAELKNEILACVPQPAVNGYRVPRKSKIFGRWFRFSGTQRDQPIRLFKKSAGKYVQPIHEYVDLAGPVGTLRSSLLHYTYENLNDYFERFNRYTTQEAAYLFSKGRKIGFFQGTLRAWLLFLKLYILDLGFLDGWEGFLFCLFSSDYAFVKYAKLRALYKHGNYAA